VCTQWDPISFPLNLYDLYWPDDGRLAAETCCPNVTVIIIYIIEMIYSCVLDGNIPIYLLLDKGMASVKYRNALNGVM
jgi:hypothetical protein